MLVSTWGILAIAGAQKAAVPKPQDKLAIGEDKARQLLLLIDIDKNGKISKQEWMKFMEAEFDRLDKTGNGQLDLKELAESQVHVSPFLSVGK
jgi:Ca2+-binding EF-hand superfamily protein